MKIIVCHTKYNISIYVPKSDNNNNIYIYIYIIVCLCVD